VDLRKSIVVSSDTYYYGAAFEMGVDRIHDFMKPWGFGQLTGIDLENEAVGILPSSAWKMKRYRQKWLPGETPSIGIGQGYNNFTILQLAHATATLANDGVSIAPHLVRAIEDPITRQRRAIEGTETHRIELKPQHLELVRGAMVDVVKAGTARVAFAGAEYVAAGKTGTAQVIGIKQNEKYDARRIAERFRDHSLFMAYAPAGDPKIALALIVENGGFGAQAAAPIARQVFDYYLLGRMPRGRNDRPPRIRSEDEGEDLRDLPTDLTPEPTPCREPASMTPSMQNPWHGGADPAAAVYMLSPRDLWRRIAPRLMVFDTTLLVTLGLLSILSLVNMYSAAYDFPGRFEGIFAICCCRSR
jgi:penicillin-binding protein 2